MAQTKAELLARLPRYDATDGHYGKPCMVLRDDGDWVAYDSVAALVGVLTEPAAYTIRDVIDDSFTQQFRQARERSMVRGNMLRYIAFVTTGDEDGDPQLGVDRLKERYQALRQQIQQLGDRLQRRGDWSQHVGCVEAINELLAMKGDK